MQEHMRGGVGRGVANLLPGLSRKIDLHLLTDARHRPLETNLPQTALATPVPGVSASWLQVSAPRWLRGFDGLFHCPYYGLPRYLPVPGVATIHDLTFEHFPEWFTRRQRLAFRVQARRAARSAAIVLTVSEHVRADLISTYGMEPDRVLVAYQGVDPVFCPQAEASELLNRLGVGMPYVVALGGAARRNLPLAIAAWRPLRDQASLVVVSSEAPAPELGLYWAGPVTDADLAGLLAGASAFLYPTSYEGFGMPGLEAMACGAPVVAARHGALPEVLGEAACWAESLSVEDVSAALDALLSDEGRRRSLSEVGLQRAATRPGWDDAVEVHLEAYARAAAHGHRVFGQRNQP
jgi:glycosyltransferase involved in cell wall biosynthesis